MFGSFSPPPILMLKPNPNVMGFGGEAFGRWLGCGVEPPWMQLVPVGEQARELTSSLSVTWGHTEKRVVSHLEEGPHQTCPCWQPNLRLPDSRNVRNTLLLFASHMVYGTLLQLLEEANTYPAAWLVSSICGGRCLNVELKEKLGIVISYLSQQRVNWRIIWRLTWNTPVKASATEHNDQQTNGSRPLLGPDQCRTRSPSVRKVDYGQKMSLQIQKLSLKSMLCS